MAEVRAEAQLQEQAGGPTKAGARELIQIMVAYETVLNMHRRAIDSLNVFPVPDGDTGTNMAMTVTSVVKEIEEADTASDVAAVCKAISHGSLMGARGNSGVILCQILRGLSEAFAEADECNPSSLAKGLVLARQSAYEAVLEPKEGTILTVLKDIATEACEAEGCDLTEMADRCKAAGQESLERTPELLAVLAEAGVVDAGGAGLVLFWDAVLSVIDGRDLPEPPAELPGVVGMTGTAASTGAASSGAASEEPGIAATHAAGDQRYEVMYFLETSDDNIASFREVWGSIGDSIVVVGGDNLWNCHIHTNDIAAAIEAGIEAGRPRQIKITDLFEQVEHIESDMHIESGKPICAAISVATGDGIRNLMGTLGVHSVVSGGQSMNPSTELLLQAIEAASASEVVLLPNNKNIIPVAHQAAAAKNDDLDSGKKVLVLETTSIPEGIAALSAYAPEADASENLTKMQAEIADLVVGEITRAIRTTKADGREINQGDYIAISNGQILSSATTPADAACEMLDAIITPEHELLTLFTGEPTDEATTQTLTDWLSQHHPHIEVETHNGGQPLYHYYLSLI